MKIMSARQGYRFFIGVFLLVLMVGFVAIFHLSQQQLDESRQSHLRCEQQQEALNARLQAIVEHKFRVEKSLETERREHLETKQNFEQKLKEQKEHHNKIIMESNVRFDSLQQHYKLLQSEHNDLVEDCTKTKENHLEQINGLERKVKSLLSQVQQIKNQHNKDIEQWKVKYDALEHEKQRTDVLLRTSTSSNDYVVQRCKRTNDKLEKLLAQYKVHCKYIPSQQNIDDTDLDNDGGAAGTGGDGSLPAPETKNIAAQIEQNKIAPNLLVHSSKDNVLPAAAEENNKGNNNNNNNNSENKHVLQQPPPLHAPIKSSTAASPLKTPDNSRSNDNNRPREANYYASIANPTSEKNKRSSSTLANDRNKETGGRLRSRPIPLGVAPIPENFETFDKNNEENNQSGGNGGGGVRASGAADNNGGVSGGNNNNNNGNNNNNNNNRYANVIDELSGKKDDPEQDNGANEIKDDVNGVDDDNEKNNNEKDHLHEILDNVNNAAEDDTNNNFIDLKGLGVGIGGDGGGRQQKQKRNKDDVDVEMIGGGGGGNNINGMKHNNKAMIDNGVGVGIGGDGILEGDDKLINEVVGDQGKEAAFVDGSHLEEGNEEDDDDYLNPGARQREGQPVRH